MTASIPSPSQGVWNLGPLPLRGYALCSGMYDLRGPRLSKRSARGQFGRRGERFDPGI